MLGTPANFRSRLVSSVYAVTADAALESIKFSMQCKDHDEGFNLLFYQISQVSFIWFKHSKTEISLLCVVIMFILQVQYITAGYIVVDKQNSFYVLSRNQSYMFWLDCDPALKIKADCCESATYFST